LLIDIGNSSLKWAILKMGSESNFPSPILSDSSIGKFDSDPIFNMHSQQYPENVTAAFFIECWKNVEKPIKIIASCVAQKHVWQALVVACEKLWELDIQKVESRKEGCGLINGYHNASDLGSDRWCAMIGTCQVADSAFIVVDTGSALTVDMVNESGQHLGGYIAPGLSMMKKSLGLHTAQVKVDAAQNLTPSLSLAQSTKECVEAGIHLSAVKLIEAVFENESRQVKTLQCYLTGGDANLIAGLLGFKCVIMPDIVLRGLAYIAETQNSNQE
jgi:type III pantothenate kinase